MNNNTDLSTPIQYVKGVGPERSKVFARLGIKQIKDALFYLPFRYEDRSSFSKIVNLEIGKTSVIIGNVLKSDIIIPNAKRSPIKIFELIVSDGSGIIRAKWFNQTYLQKIFKKGQKVVIYGTVRYDRMGFEIINPEYEILDKDLDFDKKSSLGIHTGRIVPIYRLTEGISQRQMRTIMHSIIDSSLKYIKDPIPKEIIKSYNFPDLKESIKNAHFPEPNVSLDDLNKGITAYHKRLAFDELFKFQLGLASIKKKDAFEKGISFISSGQLVNKLLLKLPFQLTEAQKRVFGEILKDMRSPYPMNRLIQGDVGSGKTIIALMAMLVAVECGYQSALMVPTEILAEQHYLNIYKLVEDLGLKISLVTKSTKEKKADSFFSDADIIIGTHALIQEKMQFKKLGLVVIDEQHRFGVIQRSILRKKGINPDTLVMTATPIPRTLAMTVYGDLDYSIIDELPPNRSPIITRLFYERDKSLIYKIIEEQINKNRQVYVVYPLIEESENTDLKSAIIGAERLQKIFPNLKVGLLHGRMKPSEREYIMAEFKRGNIDILVSTTVIEVGVDVPNATLMIIIHAERFGLAQLHQLRGRVGRGGEQSYCILLSYGGGEEARKRLEVMVRTTDGFEIAEEDLKIRGPGDFFGTRQSGMPDLKIANILRDVKILEIAKKEAFNLIESDITLKNYPELKVSIEECWGEKFELLKTA
jgi:ATP-dependent DNA helicase RecG